MSSIGVRILHTHYDHLSLLARMARLKIHTPSCRSDITTNTAVPATSIPVIRNTGIFHRVLSRSLAGGEEVPADPDLPEQGETKEEEEVKDDKTQPQKLDEEVQSVQGQEGRKVIQKKKWLCWVPTFNVVFSVLLCVCVCVSHRA